MRHIFQTLEEVIRHGKSVAWTALVETRGSTPQKAGATMLVFPDGSQTGTLGGGCQMRVTEVCWMPSSATRRARGAAGALAAAVVTLARGFESRPVQPTSVMAHTTTSEMTVLGGKGLLLGTPSPPPRVKVVAMSSVTTVSR